MVGFHPHTDNHLVTAGMGHVKFWKMAKTFTGLKLQGSVGKFGASELSDIVAFVQLPDGKVLSSTETGNLLLWEGGAVKCEIGRKEGKCHRGAIEVVLMGEGEILTAGDDGVIRIWDAQAVDEADLVDVPGGSTLDRLVTLEPLDEITVGNNVKVCPL